MAGFLLRAVCVLAFSVLAGTVYAERPLLETLAGQAVGGDTLPKGGLIVFWHPDCSYCLQELKALQGSQDRELLAHTATVALLPHDSVQQGHYVLPTTTLNLASRGNPADVLERYGNREGALPYAIITRPDGSLCQQLYGSQELAGLHTALAGCRAKP